MKLYHLSQSVNNGYDTYSDCVVAAKSAKDAKTIHPNDYTVVAEGMDPWDLMTWASPKHVTATCVGTASRGVKRGVICASFHAG